MIDLHALVSAISEDTRAAETLARAIEPYLRVPQPACENEYLTPKEAATFLRCRVRRIYELTQDGRLRRYGDGRRLLLRRQEIEALASSKGGPRG